MSKATSVFQLEQLTEPSGHVFRELQSPQPGRTFVYKTHKKGLFNGQKLSMIRQSSIRGKKIEGAVSKLTGSEPS